MRIALTGNPNSGKTTMYNAHTDIQFSLEEGAETAPEQDRDIGTSA
jgi:broad-specificity NMP kinase